MLAVTEILMILYYLLFQSYVTNARTHYGEENVFRIIGELFEIRKLTVFFVAFRKLIWFLGISSIGSEKPLVSL